MSARMTELVVIGAGGEDEPTAVALSAWRLSRAAEVSSRGLQLHSQLITPAASCELSVRRGPAQGAHPGGAAAAGRAAGEPTAAIIPTENPCCSCMLTRVRAGHEQHRPGRGASSSPSTRVLPFR